MFRYPKFVIDDGARPGGETGKHRRLKIVRLTACGFESRPGYPFFFHRPLKASDFIQVVAGEFAERSWLGAQLIHRMTKQSL